MAESLTLEEVTISRVGEHRTLDPHESQLLSPAAQAPVPLDTSAEVTGRSATPDRLLLGSLNHPRLRLIRSLPLIITREESYVIAHMPELEEFGYGLHLTAAIQDLRQSLVELYQGLEADQDRLGPDLTDLWQMLQQFIRAR